MTLPRLPREFSNELPLHLLSYGQGKTVDLAASPTPGAVALPTGYTVVEIAFTGTTVSAHVAMGASDVTVTSSDGEWDMYFSDEVRVRVVPVRTGQTHVIATGSGVMRIMGRY